MDVDGPADANGNIQPPVTTAANSPTTGTPPTASPRSAFGLHRPYYRVSYDDANALLDQWVRPGSGRANNRGSAGRARPDTRGSPGSVRGGHQPQSSSRGRANARAEAMEELGRRTGSIRPRSVNYRPRWGPIHSNISFPQGLVLDDRLQRRQLSPARAPRGGPGSRSGRGRPGPP